MEDTELLPLLLSFADFSEAPPWLQDAVGILAVVVAVATTLNPLLPAMRAKAQSTKTEVDNVLVAGLAWVVDLVLGLFAWVRFVPRLTAGGSGAAPKTGSGDDDGPPTRPLRPVATAALVLLSVITLGCSPQRSQTVHARLDTTTDVVDPTYGLMVDVCDELEGWAIERHPPEEGAEARAEVARIRRDCDTIFASFEQLRVAQLAVRAAADALEDGTVDERELLGALDELADVKRSAYELVAAFRARYGRSPGGER